MLATGQLQLPSLRRHLPFLAVFTFIAIALFSQHLIFNSVEGTFFSKTKILLSQILVFNLYALLIPVFIHLAKQYPLSSQRLLSNLAVHILTSIVTSALHLLLSQIIYHLLWEMVDETFYSKLTLLFKRWLYVEILIYWVIIIVTNSKKAIDKKDTAPTTQKFAVKHKGRTIFLDLNEVNWLQAYDAYVKVYTDQKVYLKRSKISEIEKHLPQSQFQRIHRSSIVNISKIKAMEPYSNGEQFIILESDEKLKLSRSYKGKLDQLIPSNLIRSPIR